MTRAAAWLIQHSGNLMKWTWKVLVVLAFLISQQGSGFDIGWSPQPSSTQSNLRGVSCSDASTWIAVGDGGTIVRSSDGGVAWSTVSSTIADHLRGVSFRGTVGLAVGFSGRVLRSTDAGLSWTAVSRPTSRNLYSVSIGDSVSVITGEEGTILVSTDAGMTWLPRSAGTASVLFGVAVYGRTAIGVGGQGAAVMSVNSGQGWGLTVLGPPQQLFFYGTSFVSETTGWAVGAYQATGSIIVKSTQSGFVWNLQTAPTTNTLFGVSFASSDTGTAVGFSGTIVHTTNGGSEWLSQPSNTSQSLNAVSFFDSRIGVAVGDSGTILLTKSGGLTGVVQPRQSASPLSFHLEQNYPNPFNPISEIGFQIAERGYVTLKVYDLLGNEVVTLVNETKEPGRYRMRFDASNLATGAYFYRLVAGQFVETRKLLLVR